MLKAVALDDEQPALEIIEAYCGQTDLVDLRHGFTRTSDAEAYLTEFAVDLLFLDINMPNQSGMDFYRKSLQTGDAPNLMVIFTTAHSDYAVESYTLNAIDYLLKPFTYERFLQAVQKAHEHQAMLMTFPGQEQLTLRIEYGLVKIQLGDILFIEGLDNYLKIHLDNRKPLIVRLTMKAMLDRLPSQGFARVHRSYIVALSRVQAVRNKMIRIGEAEIPISGSYETDFFTFFNGN